MAVLIMAQQSKTNNNAANIVNTSDNSRTCQLQQPGKPMLYDFLGMKPTVYSSPVTLAPKPSVSESSPTASASVGASSGGGRGPMSSNSDLASERLVGNHLEGIPFYGTRSDISGPEISNRLVGSKRSNSESTFKGHDYPENLHLMKILRNSAEGERFRRSNDDEMLYRMQQLRPTSASVMLQPSGIGRIDANVSRWERTIPMNVSHAVQYPLRGCQLVPFLHQVPTNRLKDGIAGPSMMNSQSAADEGSRTGIKGPDILSSINANGSLSEKNSSALLPSGSKPKSGTLISEPESSNPSRQGLTSAGRQMTIFYGGQAHVFDDVHPNKADVIMALAGSNGGSWSTTYSPKSTVRPIGENFLPSGDLEACLTGNTALPQELRVRSSATGNTNHGASSNDRISTPTGFQGNLGVPKDTKNNPNQAAEPSNEEKSKI